MTIAELDQERIKFDTSFTRYVNNYMHRNRKMIRNRYQKYPIVLHAQWSTRTWGTWQVDFFADSYSEAKRGMNVHAFQTYYIDKHNNKGEKFYDSNVGTGLYIYSRDCITMVAPHCVNRYKERFLKDNAVYYSFGEIARMISENIYHSSSFIPEDVDDTVCTCEVRSNDGIFLGISNFLRTAQIIKTYINNDMQYDKQRQTGVVVSFIEKLGLDLSSPQKIDDVLGRVKVDKNGRLYLEDKTNKQSD